MAHHAAEEQLQQERYLRDSQADAKRRHDEYLQKKLDKGPCKFEQVMRPREIMLGMLDGLNFQEIAQSAKAKMQCATDWKKKLDRGKQFDMAFEYLRRALEQDPLKISSRGLQFDTEGVVKVESRIEQRKREYEESIIPGYITSAFSLIAVEFLWLATVSLIDYDYSGLTFTGMPETLDTALKAAHQRLYMPTLSLTLVKGKKKVKGLRLDNWIMEVNGTDLIEDVREFVSEYSNAQELLSAGDTEAAATGFRGVGRILANMSMLETRVQSKQRTGSKRRTSIARELATFERGEPDHSDSSEDKSSSEEEPMSPVAPGERLRRASIT